MGVTNMQTSDISSTTSTAGSRRSTVSSCSDDPVNYYLINVDGQMLHGIHMRIEKFPCGAEAGMIVYEYRRQTVDKIMFRLNKKSTEKKMILDAWPVEDPNNIFNIYPVIEGDDLVGLDAHFDHDDQFIAHFRSDNEYDEIMTEVESAPTILITELLAVGC